MSSTNPLKACPFCGKSENLKSTNVGVELGDREYAILCKNCWIEGPADYELEEAVRLWNTRPEEQKQA